MLQLSKYVNAFIEEVLAQVKYKKAHGTIAKELNNHIDELTEGYIAEGIEEDAAFCKAVAQMGDPIEIGKCLHKTHKPKTEWSIIALLGAVIVYGLYVISLYSSLHFDLDIFNRQMLFAGLGICVILVFYFFDYTKLEKYSMPAYFLTCLFFLLIIVFGQKVHGRSYFVIFEVGFNPSFISIPLILIFYAGLVKKWCDGKLENLFKLLAVTILPLFCILLEPSLINLFVTGAGLLTMLTFGICGRDFKGNRRRTLLILYGSLCALATSFFIYFFGRTERLTIFLNPQSDPQGVGYTNILLDNILSSAKLFGNSISLESNGNGFYFFPGANSEFIFTFIVGGLGWIFGIFLIALLGLIILRLFIASSKVVHEYGKYLCVGICCVFSLQVLVNILMNLGLFPIFSISLPFFSYGGASYLFNMALIGLLLGVYRRKDILENLQN